MTEDEKEFADLVLKYRDAQIKYTTLEHNKTSTPDYETDHQGYISVATIAAYKKELAAYNESQEAIQNAASELAAAKTALEAYFPSAVKATIGRNVGMFAPVPGGVIGLLKENSGYALFMGRDQADARSKMDYHFQMRQARNR